jgi:hypothetical protein
MTKREKRYEIIWTPDKKEKAIEIITRFLESHGPGEVIMQDDDAQINAPSLLADIADDVLIEGEGINYIGD